MGFGGVLLAVVTLALASSQTDAQSTRQGTGGSLGRSDSSFDARMKMYSDWSKFATRQGRRLADSPQTAPLVKPFVASYGSPPPTPSTPVTPSSPSSTPSPPAYGSPTTTPTGPPSGPAGYSSGGGGGNCNVLKYITGFVNLTVYDYTTIANTKNFGECCYWCGVDPNCAAWTRVAAGSPDIRNCYLKHNLTDIDTNPDAYLHNSPAPLPYGSKYPELRYTDPNYPTPAAPIILESGTKSSYYPAELYGCPYPLSPAGACLAPPTCNCFNNVCYGPCIG